MDYHKIKSYIVHVMSSAKFPPEMLYVAIASAGGVAKYFNEYIKTSKFSKLMLAANMFVSGFSGFIFAKFSVALGLEPEMSYTMAGLGGFMGVRAIDFIEDVLKRRNTPQQ